MPVKALAAVFLISSGIHAQPAFEVVSIKPSPPDQPGMYRSMDKGRLLLRNASLRYCIETAYQLQDFQLSGGPKWLDSDHYEIDGKTPAAATYEQMLPMMQTMLADRFQLQFHRETRMAPGYALVIAKNGPKLPKPEFEGRPGGLGTGRGMVNGQNQTMAGLTEALSRSLGRPVVDETQYNEKFDFKLTWAPNDAASPPGELVATDNLPSLFAAIQEQLGLKLESRRVPVEVLVIDHAEKPAAN